MCYFVRVVLGIVQRVVIGMVLGVVPKCSISLFTNVAHDKSSALYLALILECYKTGWMDWVGWVAILCKRCGDNIKIYLIFSFWYRNCISNFCNSLRKIF